MTEFSAKTEKLASAIYFVTGFFSDQEPVKWKLRNFASELVSLTVPVKDSLLKGGEAVVLETKNVVLKIMGLLSVVRNAGMISADNYNLLRGELTKYVDTLDYPVNISALLDIEYSGLKINEQAGENHDVKDKIEYALPTKGQISAIAQKEKSLKEFGVVSMKKNSRQGIIVALLKRKKEVMIKDISSVISGYSEKTIQRELSAMVKAGVLRRMGEKRWSRYSLA